MGLKTRFLFLWGSLVLVAVAGRTLGAQPNGDEGDRDRRRGAVTAALRPTLPPAWSEAFRWRAIGPANMSGRITALAVYEKDPRLFWAGTASGGLLKTENGGITFTHQFEHEGSSSVGDVAVFPGDPRIVWVGTGEANPRNSVTWGDGVYKSTNGGRTWKHMGLAKSFQIGAVVIHPTNPNIVYVGALGRLWGPNKERGLYKTTDGGKTWKKILYVDTKTGVVDIAMDPRHPDTLLVATYERQRDGFDTNDPAKKWGPGSGLWKTTDGGRTWKRITKGLPPSHLGRIGLSWSRKTPNLVYAVVECADIGKAPPDSPWAGFRGENAEVGIRITRISSGSPAEKAGLKVGDILVEMDGELLHTYGQFEKRMYRHKAGDTVELKLARNRKTVTVKLTFGKRPARQARRGRRFFGRFRRGDANRPYGTRLGGQQPNIQHRQGPEGWKYGGLYRSTDGGETWTRVNSINPRPMYFSEVRVDPTDDRRIYVLGIALHVSEDGGKTFRTLRGFHADQHALWINPRDGRHLILGNDGGLYVSRDRGAHWDHLNHVAIGQFYHVAVGPRRNYRVYGGLQDNGSWGGPNRTPDGRGPRNSDWFRVGGGDGFVCRVDPLDPDQIYFESQNGAMGWINLRTGERMRVRPRREPGRSYRFNWNTPFVLSHHNSRLFYCAGNYVFHSVDRGRRLERISPEIARTDRGTATALAESPIDPNVLYVGTDDGALWVTRDRGRHWTPLHVPNGQPRATWAERPAGVSAFRLRLLQRIFALDRDGDGKVERAQVPERLRHTFDRFDRNRDQVLTKAEAGLIPTRAAAAVRARPVVPPGQDLLSGTWSGEPERPVMGFQPGFRLVLRLARDGTVTGEVRTERGTRSLEGGQYDPESRQLVAVVDVGFTSLELTATVEKDRLQGELNAGFFTVPFTARRVAGPEAAPPPGKPLPELLPGPRWVSSLCASRFKAGRCYVTFDGHRSDDDEPYVFVTEDYGRTWRSLRGNLPTRAGSARVILEDLKNENLLFLGCEFGAWVSVDRGRTWTRLGKNLPTVAVHDFAIHPLADEIVAATHGRSLWILDIGALRQITPATVAAAHHLYRPSPAVLWKRHPRRGGTNREFVGENPPAGALIYYSLAKPAREVKLWIEDAAGKRLRTLQASPKAGLHRVLWDLRREATRRNFRARFGSRLARIPAAQRAELLRRFARMRGGPRVGPGTYVAVLQVDGEEERQSFQVLLDPDHPDEAWVLEEDWADLVRLWEALEREEPNH